MINRIIRVDCVKCKNAFEWNTKDEVEICPRCKIIHGDDVTAIIAELRKTKIPGQEPLLRLIEVLGEKIKALETKRGEKNETKSV